jgi:hypothetical protein
MRQIDRPFSAKEKFIYFQGNPDNIQLEKNFTSCINSTDSTSYSEKINNAISRGTAPLAN